MHQEPDVGFDPGSPGSRPGPKAGAKPLCHPGIPYFAIFIVMCLGVNLLLFILLVVLCASFQSCFAYSKSFALPYEFYSLSISTKGCWDFDWHCTEQRDHQEEHQDLNTEWGAWVAQAD